MNATVALTVLAVLPPALMAIAHVYANMSQDKKAWCVVLLDNRVSSVDRVIKEHQARYHIVVIQTWDAASKGYRARIPLKHVAAVKSDHRVKVLEHWEQDDFQEFNTAPSRP